MKKTFYFNGPFILIFFLYISAFHFSTSSAQFEKNQRNEYQEIEEITYLENLDDVSQGSQQKLQTIFDDLNSINNTLLNQAQSFDNLAKNFLTESQTQKEQLIKTKNQLSDEVLPLNLMIETTSNVQEKVDLELKTFNVEKKIESLNLIFEQGQFLIFQFNQLKKTIEIKLKNFKFQAEKYRQLKPLSSGQLMELKFIVSQRNKFIIKTEDLTEKIETEIEKFEALREELIRVQETLDFFTSSQLESRKGFFTRQMNQINQRIKDEKNILEKIKTLISSTQDFTLNSIVNSSTGQKCHQDASDCCKICYSEFAEDDELVAINLNCGHQICHECVSGHLKNQIRMKNYPLKCPVCDPKWGVPFEMDEKNFNLVKLNEEILHRLVFDDLKDKLILSKKFLPCSSEECPNFLYLDPALKLDSNNRHLQCDFCQEKTCIFCKTDECLKRDFCEQDEASQKVLAAKMKALGFTSCPYCSTWSEKISGCPYVTCGNLKCKRPFDFTTGLPWTVKMAKLRGYHMKEAQENEVLSLPVENQLNL
jgi:hypothetical protein